MSERLQFSTDAALIARLGRELVGRQETALTELVKNSFDADATQVVVTLETEDDHPVALEIEDNGCGMSRQDILNGFLRIASDEKVRFPLSKVFERQRAGRKGIGRFAAERLGSYLILNTWAKEGKPGLTLEIDWDDFKPGKSLSEVSVTLSETEPGPQGSTLRISGLRDNWSDSQLKSCLYKLSGIIQPFPIAPVLGEAKADPGFSVEFRKGSEALFDDAVADIQSQIFDYAVAVFEARTTKTNGAEWRISKNAVGKATKWESIDVSELGRIPNGIHMRAHYFIVEAMKATHLASGRIRTLLSEHGGVRLYRNGFRVVPYGESGDDWLGLDQIYGRRNPGVTLAPVANRNFFGVVEVSDPDGEHFEELTSREGIVESPEFEAIRKILTASIVSAANRIASDRGTVGKRGRESNPGAASAGEFVERGRRTLAGVIDTVKENSSGNLDKIVEQLEQIDKDLTQSGEALVQEGEMLRFLASIGLASAEFTHETLMTFQAFGLDLQTLIEFVQRNDVDDSAKEAAKRAAISRQRLEAFTGYFSDAMASRNLRMRKPLSIKLSILEFEAGTTPFTDRQSIALETKVPELDPLFSAPLHEAEISSVLLNFLTNSIKAIKRKGGSRRIRIEAGRTENNYIFVRFCDTGDGVERNIREDVFRPFFTKSASAKAKRSNQTQSVGTGLGLWIVSDIIDHVGGEISIIDPPDGFSTCFEILIPSEENAP